MVHRFKAVIWDLVGVLWREEDPAPRVDLAAQYGLDVEVMNDLVFSSQSATMATGGIISEEEHWNWAAGQIGIRPEDLPEFQRRFWAGDRLDMNLARFINSLKKEYKTSLLSNAWSGTRKLILEILGSDKIFHEIMISAEVGLAKPDPAIYVKILERLDVQPQEAIFLDDTLENVTSASELGIHAIHFHTSGQAIADVRALLG